MSNEVSALPTLAARINERHALALGAARTAIEHALEVGRLLIEAKTQVAHGKWLPWIEANLTFGPRQAQKYIRLAQHGDAAKCDSNSHLTINQAVALLAAPKADDLTKEHWLAEMQRLWDEMSPAPRKLFY
jgi:hypothetical protein